jgi:DNA-binding CsgD family transcriptional regulator/tetratricopeptide (TPR) repeat protein
VGREAELAVARQALAVLPRGAGGVQLVAGESGIGKSRFAEEVAAEAEATGVQALKVQCPPIDGRPAYWPWSELLRQLLSEAERTSWALPGEDVLAQIERPTVQQSIDARTRFFQGVRTRLEQAAGSAGLLVVLDDLHWADEPSLQLLCYLSAAVSASPLLFLATYRPDEVHHSHPMRRALPLLARQPGMSRIVLQGLRSADVEHYARAVLGPAFDRRQGKSLYLRTSGHPFFVTELVEMMRAGGQDRVPESIREMLSENLDRVSGRTLAALRAGAVIGQEFGLAILQAVTDQRAEDLVSDLAAAIDGRLLVRTAQPPGRFAFRHLLIREILYEGMPALDRMRLHRRAAEALEQLREPALDEHLGELARHWLAAATPDALVRGAAFAQRAAESAMAGLGYEEAARLYELALGADPPDAERCRLLLGQATACFRLGEIRHSVASCRQAAGIARQIRRPELLAEAALVVHHVGDRDANIFLADLCEEALAALSAGTTSLRARLTAQQSIVLSLLGRRPSSNLRAMAAEAMNLAAEGDDPEAVFSALDARQRLLAGVAGDEERVGLGERAVNLAAASGRRSYAVSGRMWRIDARLKLGQTRHVDADLREVVSMGAALRQPVVDWQVLTIRATLAELAGRLADAERLIRQAHATGCPAEDGGIDCYFRGFMSGLGRLRGGFAEWESALWELIRERPGEPPFGEAFIATGYLDLGREAEARALYQQTMARLDALTPDTRPLSLLAYLSELACAFDDKDSAALLYNALLPYSRSHLVPGYGTFACEGTISRFLGMLAACRGRLETAEAHLRQAVEDNAQAGALPFVAMSQFEYARLLRRRGRTRDMRAAAERARQARESASAMGMRPLLRRAEAFIRELDTGSPSVLTPREAEISRLVAGGLANREVARQLGISVRTVESHVDHILTKLGLSSRAQLRPNP